MNMTISQEIRIRDVEERDLQEVKSILELSFEGWYLWAGLRGLERSDKVLVAESDGSVAGVVELRFVEAGERVGIVYYLATHPTHRAKGVASALLEASLQLFIEKGAKTALCSIEQENLPSQEFFKKYIFIETSALSLAAKYKVHFFSILRRATIVPGEVIFTKPLV